ncbi:MAG: SDR family oxidoreductase [Alphaproteobacteria bacterium]|jgi:NADP-dependent 3-hydroxy acid dehydrogenase YdfG
MTDEPILKPGAVALVTGASAGIGTAIAEALVAKGCQVICTARRLDRLKALAERLGENCHAVELDVADAKATAGLIDSLPESLREIDILINNAGHDVGGRQPFIDGDVEDWASIIDTNVTGLIRVSHAVIPGMVARGRGHVVNLGSISGIGPAPECNVYTASKFAVHGLSRNLRLDFAGSGIRVTEIMPGTVRTEFGAARWAGDEARADEFYDSFATVLVPDDIARCVVFALEQPANMIVAEMVVMPTAQG